MKIRSAIGAILCGGALVLALGFGAGAASAQNDPYTQQPPSSVTPSSTAPGATPTSVAPTTVAAPSSTVVAPVAPQSESTVTTSAAISSPPAEVESAGVTRGPALPVTGTDIFQLALIGAAFVIVGAALRVTKRRRSA